MTTDAAVRSLAARIVAAFLRGNFSLLLILLSLGMGAAALLVTPREEDPQIVVPFVDVHVEVPGATAEETIRLAAEPLERLLLEIPGVEHVYSMSRAGGTVVTVRFEVGQDREKALVNVYNKIQSNLDRVPPQVSRWIVKPIEIDDVPILTVTLYERRPKGRSLVRYADEIAARLQEVEDVSRVDVVGGSRRALRVVVDPPRLHARGSSLLAVRRALETTNRNVVAGVLERPGEPLLVEAGGFLRSAEEVADLVVAEREGAVVRVRDVARVEDGPAAPETYTRIAFGPAAPVVRRGTAVPADLVDGVLRPAVTIAVSKRKGTNAVAVARDALACFEELAPEILPEDVGYQVTRNYGETADEKVNELVGHLMIAVATIVVLLGASLGWRAALVVALAVPLTLAVTLFGDLVVGYTINRVTLFALILSLGLLVDDPIVDVENIHRHLSLGRRPAFEATLDAVDEVRPPTILATLTVIASFLPLFFVTGMMGPYMRPMPFNVPVAMLVSLGIAFTITPWAAYHALRKHVLPLAPDQRHHEAPEGALQRLYRRVAGALIRDRRKGVVFLALIGLAFVASLALAGLRLVPMKMLPFDNKSELQVVVNAPETFTLERTDRAVVELAHALLAVEEVTDVETYTGHASPHDFNGLVRHSFLRRGPHVADLRVNLLPRHERGRQTHRIALAVRRRLEAIAARHGVRIRIVETPPGPPVLASVVAEVHAPRNATPARLAEATREVERRFTAIPYLRDVDTYLAAPRPRAKYEVDRTRAAVHGVPVPAVAETLRMALSGADAGPLHAPHEARPLPIRIELPRAARSSPHDLAALMVPSSHGALVPLSALVRPVTVAEDPVRFRKDLRELQYVTAESVGHSPVEAVLALQEDLARNPPPEGFEVELAGEGEWQITVDVFRDMGIAFAGALAGIYVLLVAQIGSFAISGLVMLAIPLTMIGIFPGFWLLNTLFGGSVDGWADPIFFTATGMIGMIALAGIVVRNSIILIDFIRHHEARGMCTADACVEAGTIRLRPILLTAGAAVLGAWVIVFDPIFSGLAWSFVFGIAASTGFTVLVIPIVYGLTRSGARGAASSS